MAVRGDCLHRVNKGPAGVREFLEGSLEEVAPELRLEDEIRREPGEGFQQREEHAQGHGAG